MDYTQLFVNNSTGTAIYALEIARWVETGATYIGIALVALFAFAVGFAVAKGALRFVLKRLHLLS